MRKQALKEIEEFFVNYRKLHGKKYKLLGIKGEKTALASMAKARKAAKRSRKLTT
jgi:inorganic pyrophosphatase